MHKYMSACSYEDMKESLKNEDVAVATFSDDIIVSCMVLAMCGWSKRCVELSVKFLEIYLENILIVKVLPFKKLLQN